MIFFVPVIQSDDFMSLLSRFYFVLGYGELLQMQRVRYESSKQV